MSAERNANEYLYNRALRVKRLENGRQAALLLRNERALVFKREEVLALKDTARAAIDELRSVSGKETGTCETRPRLIWRFDGREVVLNVRKHNVTLNSDTGPERSFCPTLPQYKVIFALAHSNGILSHSVLAETLQYPTSRELVGSFVRRKIYEIREKLEGLAPGLGGILINVRGVGYFIDSHVDIGKNRVDSK
jgi:DNA-binding response OmpR family regulator